MYLLPVGICPRFFLPPPCDIVVEISASSSSSPLSCSCHGQREKVVCWDKKGPSKKEGSSTMKRQELDQTRSIRGNALLSGTKPSACFYRFFFSSLLFYFNVCNLEKRSSYGFMFIDMSTVCTRTYYSWGWHACCKYKRAVSIQSAT